MSVSKVEIGSRILTARSGAVLMGQLMDLMPCLAPGAVFEGIDKPEGREHPQIPLTSILRSEIALTASGMSDFDDVEILRASPEFFQDVLGIEERFPSAATLRQRLDNVSPDVVRFLQDANVDLLKRSGVELGTLEGDMVPMDFDATPFDNSKTKKEGVEMTYKKFMGYTPFYVTIGTQGFIALDDFRPGKAHSQRGGTELLARSLSIGRKLTGKTILVRMDSGNDAADNLVLLMEAENVEFIIKRNMRLRKSEMNSLTLDLIKVSTNIKDVKDGLREGKRVFFGSYTLPVHSKKFDRDTEVRCVYEITERTSLPDGQLLIEPEYESNFYWASRSVSEWSDEQVVQMYHDHATMEQSHSMLKTDMDLERVPSGKFQTNKLFMQLAAIGCNMLRLISCLVQDVEEMLNPASPDKAPPRHRERKYPWSQEVRKTNRIPLRRPKTIIANLINIPGMLSSHARSRTLQIGGHPYWCEVFVRVYEQLKTISQTPAPQAA